MKPTDIRKGAALQARLLDMKKHRTETAAKRVNTLDRDAKGLWQAKMSVEDWATVIDLVSGGESDLSIAESFGISHTAIWDKRRRDPDFRERYKEALEEAFVNIAKDIRHIVRGVEGYSSGDVRRDELIAKYDLELAKRFARKVLGDSVQIDAQVGIASVILPAIALPKPRDGGYLDSQNQDEDE